MAQSYLEHFGVKVIQRKYALKINREEFAPISTKPSLPRFESLVKRGAYEENSDKLKYREEWCKEYRELCLQNYDLTMKYFAKLDSIEFNKILNDFLEKYNKFKEVENLWDYDYVSGYYLMVLDEYKQVYIGKSEDIKRRIQSHWTAIRPFDRTLFPMYAVTSSCFSIDFFRALDTTRIYAWRTKEQRSREASLIRNFPRMYVVNRIGGDATNLIEAIGTINKRDLSML